jgi:hypothetical protein
MPAGSEKSFSRLLRLELRQTETCLLALSLNGRVSLAPR